MPSLSIVVPVYNVENFLDKCVDSILQQTFDDFELILVNDGSTDRSLSICNIYAQKDHRVRVIDKKNAGVSDARNDGIAIANGDYVGFVDPDDVIEKNMFLEMITRVIEDGSNVAMCNYYIEYPNETIAVAFPFDETILKQSQIDNFLIANMLYSEGSRKIIGSVWRMIVKRELIQANHIQFNNQLSFMEDLLWCIEVLKKTNKVSIVSKYLYHYKIYSQSASNRYKSDLYLQQQLVYNNIQDLLIAENCNQSFKNHLDMFYLEMVINAIMNECRVESTKKYSTKIYDIKRVCADGKLDLILSELGNTSISLKKRILYTLLKRRKATILYLYFSLQNK